MPGARGGAAAAHRTLRRPGARGREAPPTQPGRRGLRNGHRMISHLANDDCVYCIIYCIILYIVYIYISLIYIIQNYK